MVPREYLHIPHYWIKYEINNIHTLHAHEYQQPNSLIPTMNIFVDTQTYKHIHVPISKTYLKQISLSYFQRLLIKPLFQKYCYRDMGSSFFLYSTCFLPIWYHKPSKISLLVQLQALDMREEEQELSSKESFNKLKAEIQYTANLKRSVEGRNPDICGLRSG